MTNFLNYVCVKFLTEYKLLVQEANYFHISLVKYGQMKLGETNADGPILRVVQIVVLNMRVTILNQVE